MNPESSQPSPDDREARLTALLLGELPVAEAESLRAEIAADAELAKVFRRLSLAHELTRETVRSPEPKELSKPEALQLSAERRAALLAKFKTPPAKVVALPTSARKAWADRRELLALAAMLVAVVTSAGLLLPSLAKAKSKAQRVSAEHLLAKRAEFETQSEREELSDAPAKAAASPAAQTMTLGEPSLASRSGLVPAEKRSLAEAKAAEEARGDMVAANDTSVAFAVEAKGPAVASAALAGGAGGRAGGQDVYNWALNGVAPNASDSKVEPADKAHPGNGRASDDFGRDRDYADTSAAPAGVVANQFFGEVPALRGQGIGAGGGLRELDQVVAAGVATEDSVRRSIAAVGNTAGGFAGGRGLSAESVGAKESAVAEVDRLAVAQTSDSVRLRVPVLAEAQPSRPTLSSLAATEVLERQASSPLSDVAAVQLFDAPSPAGPLATAETIVSPGVINGPVLGSSLRGLSDEVVAERREARLEQRVNLRRDLAEGAMKPVGGADRPGQPSVLASQTTQLAFVVPPPTDSSMAQNEVARQQVALESRKGSATVERFAKATADDGSKNRLELGRGERLADLEVGQAVAAAGTPATTLGYFTETAKYSAQPVLGDVQVLGRMFRGVEAKERVADPKWIGVLEKDGDRPLPKLALGAPEPQAEVATADNAFSTFSLNVSDVSFKLAAAALEKGQMPEPATVRTEEFINAFDYRDPEPAGAAPIAFAWERARYPFAHDRDLVRFSVKTAASGRQPGRPLNLVLLLDNSGSMERADRVRIRQECLRVLAGQLQPQDRVSVVAFARTPRLWVDGLAGAQAAELPGRVGELTPDGGTNLEEALRTAYQTAARHFAANGVNRVVLLTDGAANLGDVQPDSLKRQVETNRKQGIALDCFGIGWEGLNDELLESLSRNGDGRYGFVNTPEAAQSEFAAQLVGALQVAASDVKVQVEWNPRRVTAYRQLGYAKHQLTKEQFRDNTVDAAEIGAAEAGNALYTVQVNPAGEGPLGTVRVRFKVPGTGDYREHEWPLNYDGTARPLDQAGPALRLAGGASAFSEWLVSSPWAAEVTPDRLLGLLASVTDIYAADPRPKQFEQMLRQAKSVSGK